MSDGNVKDYVFRSMKCDIPEDLFLIALSNLLSYVKFLTDTMMTAQDETGKLLVPDEVVKASALKHFGESFGYAAINHNIGNAFHLSRSKFLTQKNNTSDKERKFFVIYNDLISAYYENMIRSSNNALTGKSIEDFTQAAVAMEVFLSHEHNVLKDLIGVHDDKGKQMYDAYVEYFKSLINRSKDLVEMIKASKKELDEIEMNEAKAQIVKTEIEKELPSDKNIDTESVQ